MMVLAWFTGAGRDNKEVAGELSRVGGVLKHLPSLGECLWKDATGLALWPGVLVHLPGAPADGGFGTFPDNRPGRSLQKARDSNRIKETKMYNNFF